MPSLSPRQQPNTHFVASLSILWLGFYKQTAGKTATALAYVASEKKRALVVSPKKVLDHWVSEALTLFPNYFDKRICKISTGTGEIVKDLDEFLRNHLNEECRLVCINYELLERFFPLIRNAKLNTIILDESHYIKNSQAKRTKLLLQNRTDFSHRLLLSGTPIKNNEKEFRTQLEFLDFPNAASVVEGTPGAFWNALTKDGLYLRRSMKKEFPHSRFDSLQIIEANNAPIELRELMEIRGNKGELLLREMVEERLRKTAEFKVPFTADLAVRLVRDTADDKVIIMTERIACANELAKTVQNSLKDHADVLLHHGKMSKHDRHSTLKSFRDDGSDSPRVLVTTRPSVAVGLNLQCANNVIFNDLPWTPADILQAAARAKRLNQQKEVFEYWMLANTEFDHNLVGLLERKRELIKMWGEGLNISAEDQKWMNKRVSWKEILYGPNSQQRPKDKENSTSDNVLHGALVA